MAYLEKTSQILRIFILYIKHLLKTAKSAKIILRSNLIFHRSILIGHKCTLVSFTYKSSVKIYFVGVATCKQMHFASVVLFAGRHFLLLQKKIIKIWRRHHEA